LTPRFTPLPGGVVGESLSSRRRVAGESLASRQKSSRKSKRESERETLLGSDRFCVLQIDQPPLGGPGGKMGHMGGLQASRLQGVQVHAGCLVYSDPSPVPPALWARLRFLAHRAGRLPELQAEWAGKVARSGPPALHSRAFEWDRAFFVRWVGLVAPAGPGVGSQGRPLWPWSTGWTPERLGSYLLEGSPGEAPGAP
jgi:hypothetical protein